MSDSFFSQLEQRTQQVKITLANLEAEKTRIEDQIARLQPIVPHYDALVAAERTISDAQITLEEAQPDDDAESEAADGAGGGDSSDAWQMPPASDASGEQPEHREDAPPESEHRGW